MNTVYCAPGRGADAAEADCDCCCDDGDGCGDGDCDDVAPSAGAKPALRLRFGGLSLPSPVPPSMARKGTL